MQLEEAEKNIESEKKEKESMTAKMKNLEEENILLKSRLQDEVKKRTGIHMTK